MTDGFFQMGHSRLSDSATLIVRLQGFGSLLALSGELFPKKNASIFLFFAQNQIQRREYWSSSTGSASSDTVCLAPSGEE